MKVILVFFVTLLLLHYVTSMGQGNNRNKNKNNKNNQGNKGNNRDNDDDGDQGEKITLFPCHNRLLRAVRVENGPPGKVKKWRGVINVKKARWSQIPLTITIIFDFPTRITVVCKHFVSLK